MAKTKTSLLEQVRELKPVGINRNCWWAVIKARNPKAYQQVVEVIQDFNRGGDAFDVFRFASNMNRYLSGRDKQRPAPNLIGTVSDSSFRRFVSFVKDNPNG